MERRTNPAFRLEQALRLWEDLCFRFGLFGHVYKQIGMKPPTQPGRPVNDYHQFRKYLLESRDPLFDRTRFMEGSPGKESIIPLGLFAWNQDSRRIFHLTRDIQTLLSATHLDLAALGEVHLPFDSFAVTLDEPLLGPDGVGYDCIIFSSLGKHVADVRADQFLFLYLSDQLENIRPLRSDEKERFLKGVRSRDIRIVPTLMRDMEMMTSHSSVVLHSYFSISELRSGSAFPPGTREAQVAIPLTKDDDPDWKKFNVLADELLQKENALKQEQDAFLASSVPEQAKHLVLSLCLYLASLPAREKAGLSWQSLRDEPGQIAKAITRTAEVCTVSCSHTLSMDDRTVIREIGLTRAARQVCVHWRRGHWRKAIGLGHDPEAAKTIWVRPTLVNRHRLAEGAVPIGSAAEVR